MIKLGVVQTLTIKKSVDFGVYLSDSPGTYDAAKSVLLPKKYLSGSERVGDEIEVFIYKDSKDRLIATTQKPYIMLDEVKPLRVKEISKIGAFLDWGLEKDIFLPFKEMTSRPSVDDEILVRLYIDKSKRLAVSMRGLYSRLSTDNSYQRGDEVSGRIYEFGHDSGFGTYIAVDDRYSAMILSHEDTSNFRIGDVISATVTEVKDDGKLTLTVRKRKEEQMGDDAARLLEIIDSYAGVLPFSEKASPEVIKRETGLSKAAFKRAVGRLYKERVISLDDGKIRKI